MITSNFKKFMLDVLQHSTSNYGAYPVKTVTNSTRYTVGQIHTSVTVQVAKVANGNGIQIGSGNTAATENDYKLESQIISGFTASVNVSNIMDNGTHVLIFDITITNTGDSAITISEIGYVQSVQVASTVGGSGVSGYGFLLDRTVLPNPVTIAVGEYETIRYTLKTVQE